MGRGGGNAGFRVGDRCLTRDGQQARVLCVDLDGATGPFPIVAAIRLAQDGLEELGTYTVSGKYFRDGRTDALDLMPETIRRTVERDPLGEALNMGNGTYRP